MTKHAILTDEYVMDAEGCSSTIPFAYWQLDELCELALQWGYSHLWIHSSSGMRFAFRGERPLLLGKDWDTIAHWQYEATTYHPTDEFENYLVSLHGYKCLERGRTPRFNLIFLEYATFDWKDLTPPQILELITDIETKLQVPVGGSPAGVGLRYLQKVNERHPQWLAKPECDFSGVPFDQAARPLIWSRKATEQELSRRFLYKFDKNSAYPRAAVDERFGVGDPVYYPEGCGFDHMLPGIWRIDVEFSPDFDFTLLPSLVWNNFEWLATPIVRFLVKQGCGIHVNEAWVFPEHAYIFRNWGKNLWNFTQSYDRGTSGRAAFKQIMNELLGLVRSKMFGVDSFKYRPDWNATIVAATRADVLRKVYKYAQDGFYPVMTQLDAIYYLSDEKLPNLALPGILDHMNSLGGYKLDFCLEMTDEIRVILMTLSGSRRLQALNILAEKAGY